MSKRLTLPQLKQATLDKAATSGLKPAHVKLMGLEPVADVSKLPGMQKFPAVGGFRIPYFDLKGKPLPKVCRVRYLEETRKGFQLAAEAKPLRYVQAPGTTVHVYFPPMRDWATLAKDTSKAIVITEGELKAACGAVHGANVIGLGGVWSWKSNAQGTTLIDDLKQISWTEREVYICYDSDAVTNPDVLKAEVMLAERLTAEGALVYIMRIGAMDAEETALSEDGPPKRPKLGLDDFIVRYGYDAFIGVMDTALDPEESSEKLGCYPYDVSRAFHEYNARYLFILGMNAVYEVDQRRPHPAAAFQSTIRANDYYDGIAFAKDGTPKTVRKKLAKAWIEWPGRASVNSLVFEPGREMVHDGNLNTWRGWGYDHAEKGDVTLWTRLLDRVFLGARAEDRRWFEQWVAYPLQYPGTKVTTGVLIWGHQHGTGKSLIGEVIGCLYDPAHTVVLTEAAFEDQRNQWAVDKQFIVVDDITGRESREYANRLNNLITQPTIKIDPKYIGAYDIRHCIQYLLTANDSDALMVPNEDRRFFIHGVLGDARLDPEFGRLIMAWARSVEGRRALAYHLLNVDVTGFNPRAPAPITDAKAAMIETTRTDLGNWVTHLKENPELVLDAAKFVGDVYTAEKLYALYDPSGDKRTSARTLTRELQSQGFARAAASGLVIPGEGRRHAYIVRNAAKWLAAPVKDLAAEYLRGNPPLVSKNKKY